MVGEEGLLQHPGAAAGEEECHARRLAASRRPHQEDERVTVGAFRFLSALLQPCVAHFVSQSVHMAASDGIAYWVGFQRAMVRLDGGAEPIPFDLRVTEVFHREGDEWKLVHRHADSLASQP